MTTQQEEQTWEKELKKIHKQASANKDSGYCAGCSYYEEHLTPFLVSQRKQVRKKVIDMLKKYKCGEHKKLLNALKKT